MHRRTGLVLFFIGLSWAAVLLLVQLGGDDREELLGTSIVASLFGLALAISPVGHAARWLVLALGLAASGASLSAVWRPDDDPLLSARLPIISWLVVFATAWGGALASHLRGRPSARVAAAVALLAVSALAALLLAALIADLAGGREFELSLALTGGLAVLATLSTLVLSRREPEGPGGEASGFGERDHAEAPRRRGGRHAARG